MHDVHPLKASLIQTLLELICSSTHFLKANHISAARLLRLEKLREATFAQRGSHTIHI